MAERKKIFSLGTMCFAALLQAGTAIVLIPGNTARTSLEKEYMTIKKYYPANFYERTLRYAEAILDDGTLPDNLLDPIGKFLIPERASGAESQNRTRVGNNQENDSEDFDDAGMPTASEDKGTFERIITRKKSREEVINAPWWFSYVEQRISSAKALIELIGLRIASVFALWPAFLAFLGAALIDCIAMRKSRAARAVPPYTGRYRMMLLVGRLTAFGATVSLLWPWDENPIILHFAILASCLLLFAAFAQLRSKAKI